MRILKLTLMLLLLAGLAACKTMPTASEMYQGQTAEQIFRAGEVYLAKTDYSEAAKAFEALDSLYPFSAQSQQGQIELIYANYQDEEFTSAAAAADRFIHLYPRNQHVDYVYYLKGLADYQQDRGWFQRYLPTDVSKRDPGTMKQAYEDFKSLVTLFPDSPYAADARQRMIYLRDVFANNELTVAQFYLDHKSYVAAINRANTILQHYQNSSAVPKALAIQVRSYQALHLMADADKVLRVLKLNYPDLTG